MVSSYITNGVVNMDMTNKRKVEELFKQGQTLFYSDIVDVLDIDLKTVVGICDELREEGKIEIDRKYVEPLVGD